MATAPSFAVAASAIARAIPATGARRHVVDRARPRDIEPASADRGAAADRSLTYGRDGRLWLSLPGDHALVQIGDAVAAGTLEEEGQQTVHQTGQATEHHAQAEGARREQVLEVSLANRLGVFSEEAVRIHAVKSSPVGPQQDC